MRVTDGRVVLVTGKGGVGKTTVAVSIAVAAAERGKRVVLCETSGNTVVPGLFGKAPRGYELTELAPRLYTMSITPEAAIEDYVVQVVRFKRLYHLVFRNQVMGPFIDAVPGLHDLIQLGKVWDLERLRSAGRPTWDLIVVDAPATGHGLTMLHAPRAMMDLTVAGPFHQNAGLVAALVEDPARTSLVLVALPEDLPVNETLDLYDGLDDLRPLVRGVVLNEVHPPAVPDVRAWHRWRHRLLEQADAAGRESIALADLALARTEAEHVAAARLGAIPAPLVSLPFRFHRNLGPDDFTALARKLEAIA